MFRKLILIAALIAAALAGSRLYRFYFEENTPTVRSRESVLVQIKQLNRLESTAFYIDTIIRTEKKGNWQKLWQDSQSGLFIVKGRVVAGIDLDKLKTDNVRIIDGKALISLPPAEILSADIENIEVYDIRTGSLNLLPPDHSVIGEVQQTAKTQILASACKADILGHANRQAQSKLENLFALAQTPASVYTSTPSSCRLKTDELPR